MKWTFVIVPLVACLLFAGNGQASDRGTTHGKENVGGAAGSSRQLVAGSREQARNREIILYPNGKRARKMVCRIPLNAQDTVH